ncbi:MAG: hypothetical protein ACRD6R_05790 [Candidatus Polarisedimenticolia bacterium]
MAAEPAIEFAVRTRQKSDETYTIVVEKAPGHWIAEIRLPDGSPWLMNRFDARAAAVPRQWAGASAAAAADHAARVLGNHFASEGMEIVRRTPLLPPR